MDFQNQLGSEASQVMIYSMLADPSSRFQSACSRSSMPAASGLSLATMRFPGKKRMDRRMEGHRPDALFDQKGQG